MNYLVTLILLIAPGAIGQEFPHNCEDVQNIATRRLQNATSGVYKIYTTDGTNHAFEVFCDMTTDEGGWLVIQRRREADSQFDFYRNWSDYASGFGLLLDSHWIGLDMISALTNNANYKLRIDMMDEAGEERYAEYEYFRVANSSDLYQIHVEGFSGDAGDSLMRYHNGRLFSTYDRDNDNRDDQNCAAIFRGAWWYDACHASNLNGLYGSKSYGEGVIWSSWKGLFESLKRVEMKIRTNKKFQNL